MAFVPPAGLAGSSSQSLQLCCHTSKRILISEHPPGAGRASPGWDHLAAAPPRWKHGGCWVRDHQKLVTAFLLCQSHVKGAWNFSMWTPEPCFPPGWAGTAWLLTACKVGVLLASLASSRGAHDSVLRHRTRLRCSGGHGGEFGVGFLGIMESLKLEKTSKLNHQPSTTGIPLCLALG